MPETSPAPAPQLPPTRRGAHRLLSHFGDWYHRFHRLDRAKPHKHNAQIYAFTVAFAVPLMGFLISSFSIKITLGIIWFALAPVIYFWFQGIEMLSQIKRFGLLDPEESDYQRKKMYYLYFAVIFAFVVWLLGLVIYVSVDWPRAGGFANTRFVLTSPLNTPMYYGFVEWGILLHTALVAYVSIDFFYPLMTNYLQATAGQRRIEKEEPVVSPH